MLPCLVKCRSHPRYPSRLGNLFAATPLHSVLTPYWLKSFSCNTYGTPRKCCKQKTYGLAKPFRCNTYKKHGGGGPVMVNQQSEMDSRRARPDLFEEEHRDEGSLLPSDMGIYPEARREETAIRGSNEIANRPYLSTSLLPYFFIPAG